MRLTETMAKTTVTISCLSLSNSSSFSNSIFIEAREFQLIKAGFLIRPVYTFNAGT